MSNRDAASGKTTLPRPVVICIRCGGDHVDDDDDGGGGLDVRRGREPPDKAHRRCANRYIQTVRSMWALSRDDDDSGDNDDNTATPKHTPS